MISVVYIMKNYGGFRIAACQLFNTDSTIAIIPFLGVYPHLRYLRAEKYTMHDNQKTTCDQRLTRTDRTYPKPDTRMEACDD